MSENLPSARKVLGAGVPLTIGATLGVAAILALYLWIPEPEGDEPPWVVFTAIALVAVIYSFTGVWAVFRIHKAKHPARTGITLLSVMVTAIVVIFAMAYLSLSIDNPANFNMELTKISALYFTMTILTTVGFGDIHAQSDAAMIAVMVQMVASITLITTLGRILVETSRRAMRRRSTMPLDL